MGSLVDLSQQTEQDCLKALPGGCVKVRLYDQSSQICWISKCFFSSGESSRKVLSATPVKDHTYYSSADPFSLQELSNILESCVVEPYQQTLIVHIMKKIMKALSKYKQSVSAGSSGCLTSVPTPQSSWMISSPSIFP